MVLQRTGGEIVVPGNKGVKIKEVVKRQSDGDTNKLVHSHARMPQLGT